AADSTADDPLAPKKPHFPAKAKRVICLFSTGGVSQMDTFDPKPKLFEDDGCLIRSLSTDNNEHFQATLAIHTGSFFAARPSIGSWVSYGLGTVNRNLPSFVVIAPYLPYAGTQVFANDFLPAYHQGTRVLPGKEPVPNVKRQAGTSGLQERELGFAATLNKNHLQSHGRDRDMAARIRSFETAFQMQFEAPEAFDLSKEAQQTLDLYGVKRGDTESFGWQCLIARRLA